MALRALKKIVTRVEVERKFNPGPQFRDAFPPFHMAMSRRREFRHQPLVGRHEGPSFTVSCQPWRIIRDTYYDTVDGHLAKLGLWVRRRQNDVPSEFVTHRLNPNQDGPDCGQSPAPATHIDPDPEREWNAKLRLAGHFNDSQFAEIYGERDVSKEVLRITDNTLKLEDLHVVADLQTRRSNWEIKQLPGGTAPSARMTVVLDTVSEAPASPNSTPGTPRFSHTIGEVELFGSVKTEDKDSAEHDAYRKEISAQWMEELEGFMEAYPTVFSTNPKPLGKLSAYYGWKSRISSSESSGES